MATRAVLTDIEGTTTSISFVYDVLFPYARRRLDAACASGEPRFAEALRIMSTYDVIITRVALLSEIPLP